MTARPAPSTFYREIARNRRNSWLLVAIVVLVLAALGAAIGYATGFGWGGVVVALVVATFMSVGSLLRRRPARAALVRRARGVPSPTRPRSTSSCMNVSPR